jgi:hypothetical protein
MDRVGFEPTTSALRGRSFWAALKAGKNSISTTQPCQNPMQRRTLA